MNEFQPCRVSKINGTVVHYEPADQGPPLLLLAGLPRVRHHTLAGAGHALHRDRPEATTKAIPGFTG